MLVKLIHSLTRITVAIVVNIILIWLLLARPVFSSKASNDDYESAVDPNELKQHVELLSKQYAPRSFNYPENLNRVADYIATSFRASGATVWEQGFEVDGTQYKNVVAEYGPDSQQVIVIGAHYDTAGEQAGADDNASGVAGLLALSRLLSQEKLRSKVQLVAFTLEEPPYFATKQMGSAVFAKSLVEQDVAVKLMICLEMIGYFSNQPDSQDYPSPLLELFYPSTGHFIAIIDQVFSMQAQRMKKWMHQVIELPVYSINAPAFIPGVDFSDHRNFWHYDYPAVMITDTAFYRNQAYHTKADTANRLNYEKMAQVVYGIYSYVRYMDNET